MGFVDDNDDLPNNKVDRRPVPPGESETKFITADNWNTLVVAAEDTRDWIRAATWYGLAGQAADPAPANITNYVWLKSDGTLWKTVNGTATEIGGGGVSNGAASGRLMLSDGTDATSSAITEGTVEGEYVIGTSNGVRWDILGPFDPEVDTGIQVIMSGTGHAAEAVAVVGYVTSMDYDLSINGSQHAIGGQFKATATISTPSGVEVLENIAVQGEASGGTRNYSWYSATGKMMNKGDVELAVDPAGTSSMMIGFGTLPAAGNLQINVPVTVDPLKTVSLGNNVRPFFVVGDASTTAKISLGSPTSDGYQISLKNTHTGVADTGIGVHIDTTVLATARGGMRLYRGAGGSTQVGGFEVAGGNNSLVTGAVANDVLMYSRASGGHTILGSGTTPTARLSIDDAGKVTINSPDSGNAFTVAQSTAGVAATVTHNATAQTASATGVSISRAGSTNSTAGALSNTALSVSATSSRSAGANDVQNVAGTFTATSGQLNVALRTNAGENYLNTTGGSTGVGYAFAAALPAKLSVSGTLAVSGNVGFYGTAPAAKPTVTGSRGGNAALASLLTALASLGLITDSTTA